MTAVTTRSREWAKFFHDLAARYPHEVTVEEPPEPGYDTIFKSMREEVTAWCEANAKGEFYVVSGMVRIDGPKIISLLPVKFERQEDAALFKLFHA